MGKRLDPLKTCVNLRSKDMYYAGSAPADEAQEAAMEQAYGGSDTTAFWCGCTQGARGPDGGIVGRSECVAAGRTCFVSIERLV
jgi:hypothetical protein